MSVSCTGRKLAQAGGDCICTLEFSPVCATDPSMQSNITFQNR